MENSKVISIEELEEYTGFSKPVWFEVTRVSPRQQREGLHQNDTNVALTFKTLADKRGLQ